MPDGMNTEQSERYELFARFFEIQMAIDRIEGNGPETQDVLKVLEEQKEELITRLTTR